MLEDVRVEVQKKIKPNLNQKGNGNIRQLFTTGEKMKKQFEKVKNLACKHSSEGHKLDMMINKRWGFSYSDMGLDEIIDTLDYGHGYISYEDFVILMDKAKKEREENQVIINMTKMR